MFTTIALNVVFVKIKIKSKICLIKVIILVIKMKTFLVEFHIILLFFNIVYFIDKNQKNKTKNS